MKYMKTGFFFLIFYLLCFSGFSQGQLRTESAKIAHALQLIDNLYVDDVDIPKLGESAIRAMLHELDPHSSYLDKNEVKLMNESMEGNFEGIGISFNMLTDTLYVIEVISGGPSQKVGLMPGDRIMYVDDTLIAGVKLDNQKVIGMLKGPKGTKVDVRVLRKGYDDLLDFKIVRDKIPLHSIDAAYMVDDDIGYIKLSRFGITSYKEFLEAEKDLKAQGMKKLIFDLTGNGGGVLQVASEIVNEFLSGDKLIVYTEGKNQPRLELKTTPNKQAKQDEVILSAKKRSTSVSEGQFQEGDVVVLVDELSASASEIVAGALQDWDRGVIVGRRTFGKGLVQRQIPLLDGSMMRLTVAKYYTPTGRSIQKPYEEGQKDKYQMELMNRYQHGEYVNADSISFADSLRYETLVNKRIVYGGGGIMPDYFVPIDTVRLTDLHRNLIAKGVMSRVTINEVDNNRSELLIAYPDVNKFKSDYEISEKIFVKMKQIAESENIEWDKEQFELSEDILTVQLKALMARDLYNQSAYYVIINDINDIYKEGLRIINSDNAYDELLRSSK